MRAALARLSNEDRKILDKFKKQFPTLVPEEMAKVANSFLLFRSLYVAKKATPGGNQADHSVLASLQWKYATPDSVKARYRRWHFLIRTVWKKMYPHGFPASSIPKKKKKQPGKPVTKKAKKAKAAPRSSSSSKKFQPLPSPPVSDDAYFEEDAEQDIKEDFGDEDVSEEEDMYDDDDDEYLPAQPLRKSRSPTHRSWSQV